MCGACGCVSLSVCSVGVCGVCVGTRVVFTCMWCIHICGVWVMHAWMWYVNACGACMGVAYNISAYDS